MPYDITEAKRLADAADKALEGVCLLCRGSGMDGSITYNKVNDCHVSWWLDSGWYCLLWGSHEPTHWMPLPEPPKWESA